MYKIDKIGAGGGPEIVLLEITKHKLTQTEVWRYFKFYNILMRDSSDDVACISRY